MPAPYIAGLPSLYGLVCMGRYIVNHALLGAGLTFDAIAVCINHFHIYGSQQKYAFHSRRDMEKGQHIRIMTARDSGFDASVIIRVKLWPGYTAKQASKWLRRFKNSDDLYKLRMCGGHIIYKNHMPAPALLQQKDLPEVCKSLNGFMVADAIDLCRLERQPSEDALDTIIRLIQTEGNGWLVPLAAGYIPLGEAEKRLNTRLPILHAFVEPAIGLGRVFSTRAIAHVIGERECFFWQPDDVNYLVKGTI